MQDQKKLQMTSLPEQDQSDEEDVGHEADQAEGHDDDDEPRVEGVHRWLLLRMGGQLVKYKIFMSGQIIS